MAERLDVPVADVAAWAAADEHRGDVRMTAAHVEALVAFAQSDFACAGRRAGRLERLAVDGDHPGLWWTATFMRALADFDSEDLGSALRLADALASHWFTAGDPMLAARSQSLRSSVLRAAGRLEEAVEAAREAVRHAADADENQGGADLPAYTALVACLCESGRVTEAEAVLPQLRRSADAAPARIEEGRARWALGNVLFLLGRPAEGESEHDAAALLIDPDRHLRSWGRLNRSSAAMRLRGGGTIERVPELLEAAAGAFALSAAPSDRAELALTRGLYALTIGDMSGAERFLREALLGREYLAPQNQAEASEALGRALAARQDAGARAAFESAVATFTRVGAFERALSICREQAIPPPADAD